MNPETISCGTCGQPTTHIGTKRCDNCYEVELRLRWYLNRGGEKALIFVRETMSKFINASAPKKQGDKCEGCGAVMDDEGSVYHERGCSRTVSP